MAVVDRSAHAPAPAVARRREAERWVLAAIVVAGALLRFTTIGEQSFWYDEATTWAIVSRGLGHVISTVPRTESTPPLYYVLLWLWSRVFGLSAAGLRSFSALCGTLTIPVMWAIGRRIASRRVAMVAAALTAVNPLLFWYAQEARAYSLLLALCSLSLLALVRAIDRPDRGRLLVWGLVSALALAVHYYAAVVVAPEALWLLTTLRRDGRLTPAAATTAFAAPVIVAAALGPLMVHQDDGRAGLLASQGGSLAYRLAQLAKEDVIGMGQPDKALLTVLGLALVATALALLIRRARAGERSAALMLVVIGGGGVLLSAVAAALVADYFNTRNLMPTWPALALIVACGLGGSRAGRAGSWATAGLVVLSLVCVFNVVTNSQYQRPDWHGAVSAALPGSGTTAIVSAASSQVPLTPYVPGVRVLAPGGAAVREVAVIWVQRRYQWGPLAAIDPVALPGFTSVQVVRNPAYVVVRYRSAVARVETPATLDALYPPGYAPLALLG